MTDLLEPYVAPPMDDLPPADAARRRRRHASSAVPRLPDRRLPRRCGRDPPGDGAGSHVRVGARGLGVPGLGRCSSSPSPSASSSGPAAGWPPSRSSARRRSSARGGGPAYKTMPFGPQEHTFEAVTPVDVTCVILEGVAAVVAAVALVRPRLTARWKTHTIVFASVIPVAALVAGFLAVTSPSASAHTDAAGATGHSHSQGRSRLLPARQRSPPRHRDPRPGPGHPGRARPPDGHHPRGRRASTRPSPRPRPPATSGPGPTPPAWAPTTPRPARPS